MSEILTVIPVRMASTRLPGKPLADIAGTPMIVHVWRRAIAADVGPVVVACDHPDVEAAITSAGGDAVLTSPDHPSGSDRIWEALGHADPGGHVGTIINLQGDLPTLEPHMVRRTAALLSEGPADISTLAAEISEPKERENPNVVKVIGSQVRTGHLRALYFTRSTAPYGDGPLYHHIGIYGYRRAALERFVSLPPSPLEVREKLEQLRALEAGMRIDVALVDTVPLGVDTPADLERARSHLSRAT